MVKILEKLKGHLYDSNIDKGATMDVFEDRRSNTDWERLPKVVGSYCDPNFKSHDPV